MSDGTAELDRLAADLGKVPAVVFPLVQKAIDGTLRDVARTAKDNAPAYSGRYAASITYERTGFKGEVGPESRYGHLVEDGGARSAPNPVMAQAAKAHEDTLEERLAKAAVAGLW
jgi:hypothetical protein